MPYQVTLSEGGSPNCAGIYTEHVEYNGQMSYICTNEAGTWYLWSEVSIGIVRRRYVSTELGVVAAPLWDRLGTDYPGDYVAKIAATGIATVVELPPVAAVVTNILLGSTPERCQILNSRIVRGPL